MSAFFPFLKKKFKVTSHAIQLEKSHVYDKWYTCMCELNDKTQFKSKKIIKLDCLK